jgi:hypothetical protein
LNYTTAHLRCTTGRCTAQDVDASEQHVFGSHAFIAFLWLKEVSRIIASGKGLQIKLDTFCTFLRFKFIQNTFSCKTTD